MIRAIRRIAASVDHLARDGRTAIRFIRATGPSGALAAGRLAMARRRSVDTATPPETPLDWSDFVSALRRHYALDLMLPTRWSEAETRRDVRRIAATSSVAPSAPDAASIRMVGGRELRHVLATIEALRSLPASRSIPIDVELATDAGEAWAVLSQIPGVSVSPVRESGIGLQPIGRGHVALSIQAGELPSPMWPHPGTARHAEFSSTQASDSPRLLILNPFVPNVQRSSGAQDIYWFARHAVDLGYQVLFVATHPRLHDATSRWDLRRAGVAVVRGSLNSERIRGSLPRTIENSDVVVTFDKTLAITTRGLIQQNSRPPRLLFVPLDLKQFPQRILVERDLRPELEHFGIHVPTGEYVDRLAAEENAAMRASDLTALISTAELTELATEDFADRLTHLPMLRANLQFVASSSSRPRVVFVAGFSHPPNYLAVRWFLLEVWPRVHGQARNVTFEIFGADLRPDFAAEWASSPGVVVRGPFEHDCEPYVGDVIAVAPLLYGGGTKGKVVSAMGHGAVVIGTDFARQGLPQDMKEAVVLANTSGEFAGQLLGLIHDSRVRAKLREAGRAAYAKSFTEEAGREAVRSVLQDLTSRPTSQSSNSADQLS